MKGRSILALTIAAMLSSSTFAMEIYKGRLISHKVTTPKNAKLIFNHNKTIPPLFAKNNLDGDQEHVVAYLMAQMNPAEFKVDELSKITGAQWGSISNFTQAVQQYVYVYEICVQIDKNNMQCADVSDRFELEPRGYATMYDEPILQMTFKHPGTYKTQAYSTIFNIVNDHGGKYISTASEANSEITVLAG